MVHRRELDGEALVLGNQGALYLNAMTWWDHATGSIWSQPTGEAIAGPLTGSRLALVPSTLTTWAEWTTQHPDTVALDAPGRRLAVGLEMMAIVVDLGTEVVSYDVTVLRDAGVVDDVVAGIEIAVVVDPDDPNRWAVYSRRVGDAVVDLERAADGLVDRRTGTVFDPLRGIARSGLMAGRVLDRLPAFTMFPKDFERLFPDGRSWPEG